MKTRRLVLTLGFVGLAALGTPADNPFATTPVDGLIPPLPTSTLVLPGAPIAFTGPSFVHEGRATWGPDLADPGTTDPEAWKDYLIPAVGSPLRFTASPVFPVRVQQAWNAAKSHLTALDPATLGEVFALFEDLGKYQPGASATVKAPDTPNSFFFGYRPVRARWLRSQWGRPGPFGFLPEKKYVYSDYSAFRDVRLRGARLYCAARRAQKEQAGLPTSLGERVGFSVELLGKTIDFLVIEPTLALDGPERFTGAPGDLTRAFSVPFQLGTRVTPIRGLGLPGFDEIRVPLELVTGDTEVTTLAEKRPVFTGYVFQCPPCTVAPEFVNQHSKDYQTVTHADAVASAGFAGANQFEADAKFTLFHLGLLEVQGTLDLDFEVGAFERPDNRVLAGFPVPPAREGFLLQNPLGGVRYHDGPWLLARRGTVSYFEWQVQPEGQTDPFWTRPILPVFSLADIRAVTNDDHIAESSTGLKLTLGLAGTLGAGEGPFQITLTVTGSFTGLVTQRFVLRDALMAQDPLEPGFLPRMRPITAVSVRPRQTAGVTFNGLKAELEFYLNLGFFGEIEFKKTFFNLGAQPLAHYDSDESLSADDEEFVFRLGTGSTAGQPLKKPRVLSHLPQKAHFESFDEDVDACLADETPLPELPPPCKGQVDGGSAPKVEICMYGPEPGFLSDLVPNIPSSGVCDHVSGWVGGLAGLDDEQKECLKRYLNFLCAPVSEEQPWAGHQVISRIWNFDVPMKNELHSIVGQCAGAFIAPDDADKKAKAEALAKDLVSVGACYEDAKLLPDGDILKVVNPTQAPKATPGSCGS